MRRLWFLPLLLILAACQTWTPAPPRHTWLEDINAVRAYNGVPTVPWETDLEAMAQDWANVLCYTNSFQHRSLVSVLGGPWGYWDALNENIAQGFSSWPAVNAAWIASPGHFSNMIAPWAQAVGVGYAPCNGKHIWVQNFGNYRG